VEERPAGWAEEPVVVEPHVVIGGDPTTATALREVVLGEPFEWSIAGEQVAHQHGTVGSVLHGLRG